MFEFWLESMRVDVFLPSIDFSWEANRTKVQREVRGVKACYVRTKLAEMMGADDERVAAWDNIVSDHMPP
jgi:hypothetical protein